MTEYGMELTFDDERRMTTRDDEFFDDAELSAPLPPAYSDDSNAEAFSAKHADEARYVAKWDQWMLWRGERWSEEPYPAIMQRARTVLRNISTLVTENDTIKRRLASAQGASNLERLARGDPRHVATPEQWDAHAWLLNTPTGTVDLHTGKLRGHNREEYHSKSTAVGPGGDCPLWLKFLERVTGGDVELQGFLQRIIGYSLTASTSEQALFFLWGTGKNGKSVFLNTVSRILGDYAKTAPMSTFTASGSEQHPTDLAGLRGARLVTAIETEDGRQWAESKLKALTGGDPITARLMRQDYWTYTPTFKLLIAGNHKPTIRSVDEAMRRRINLIPFTVWIPEEERDKNLEEKLRDESTGILQWAIDGCIEWQRQGLNPPKVVMDATKEYFDAEDVVARWIEDRCECNRRYETSSSALFKDYKEWCESTGERVRSQKKLSQALTDRGFAIVHSRSGNMITSIALKQDVGGKQ